MLQYYSYKTKYKWIFFIIISIDSYLKKIIYINIGNKNYKYIYYCKGKNNYLLSI